MLLQKEEKLMNNIIQNVPFLRVYASQTKINFISVFGYWAKATGNT